MDKYWTDNRVEEVRAMWHEGQSFDAIAYLLGDGISRSAVAGKLHRMGIKRGKPKRIIRPRQKRERYTYAEGMKPERVQRFHPPKPNINTINARPMPRPPEKLKGEPFVAPMAARKTCMQLTPGDCRWPYGHVGEPGFFFCGAPAFPDKPYCAAHCRIAYRPGTALTRKPARYAEEVAA